MTNALTLFYAPNVCSLAPHIVLRELGHPFALVRVDLRTRQTSDGEDFRAISAKGYVPVLRLLDGSILTETAVVLRCLADLAPPAALAPPAGTMARVRFEESMHFVATELHKGFAPFTIMAKPSEESRAWAADRLTARVAILETELADRSFLHGDAFTALDAYAFWALQTYSRLVKKELPASLRRYVDALAERPSVRAAREAEAL